MSQVADLTQLVPAIKDIYTSRLLSGVAITLAVYDSILIFPEEFETIYNSRWSIPKSLYFYIRFVTPLGILLCTFQLSDLRPALSDNLYNMGVVANLWHALLISSCKWWALSFATETLLNAPLALFSLRLVALYRSNRVMVWFIRGFYFASYAATLGLVIDSMVTYHGELFYSDLVGVCATHTSSKTFPPIFYAPAAFEFFIFALTAYRGLQDSKVITGFGSAPFLMVLYRDGIIAFFLMTGMRVWNIWIYLTQPLSSFNLGTQMMWAISTVLTTRVYMNLVWLAKKPLITTMDTRIPATTDIRMRVHTFTEVQTDYRVRRLADPTLASVDEGIDPKQF